MIDQEKVLARVRKMLKLANDAGATEGERENALRMAHATLAKYNLELSEAPEVKDDRGQLIVSFYGRPWARATASAVGRLFFCRYVYIPNGDAKKVKHVFIGRQANAATASEMAAYVVGSINKEARRRQRELSQGNEWYRSFAWGAAQKICERVDELIKSSQNERSPGKSLVLASVYQTEQVKNDELLSQLHPRLNRGTAGKKTILGAAASQGRQYGETVNLNRQVGGGSSRTALGHGE